MQTLCLILLSLVPSGVDIRRKPDTIVDVIEINRRYDEFGNHAYSQAIMWNWDGYRYNVVAWILLDENRLNGWPEKKGEHYYAKRNDKGYKSKILKYSWTDKDPEREARR